MTRPYFGYARAGVLLSLPLVACGDQAHGPSPQATPSSTPHSTQVAFVAQELVQALSADDREVSVLIHFREVAADGQPAVMEKSRIAVVQHQLANREVPGLTITHTYRHVPAVAGSIKRSALELLKNDPDVASIEVDGVGTGHLKEAAVATGVDRVRETYGLTGKGVRVAVLDSGASITHPDLRSSIVAQSCFTRNACPPNRTVTGTSAEDDHGHGSNVTGIITSDGVLAPRGLAPDAEIVAVKINDQNNSGQESDWVAGLDWVYDNLATLKVRVVNMSIGTFQLHPEGAECDSRHPAMVRAVKNLTDAGVVVFAATGNSGSPTHLGSPSCNTGVVAVGATYDANMGHQPPGAATYYDRWRGNFARCGDDTSSVDQITCFTNSNARLDLVAPGAAISSDAARGRTDTYWGTSQASPVAAAVAALMLQCNPALTPAQIKQAMVATGFKVMDPKNRLTFPSLRAFDAVRAACPSLTGEDANGPGSPLLPPSLQPDGGSVGLAATDVGEGIDGLRSENVAGNGSGDDEIKAAGAAGCALGGAGDTSARGFSALTLALALGMLVRRRRRIN